MRLFHTQALLPLLLVRDPGQRTYSEDSALRRRREAERWLVDLEEATSVKAALPDPLAVLGAVAHRPRFLDPEATRPLAEPVHRGRLPLAAAEPAERPKGGRKRVPGEWDIASMAPPIKGTEETKLGVISAPAKRYRTDDRVGSGAVTAAQARARQLGPGVRLPVLAQKQVCSVHACWVIRAGASAKGRTGLAGGYAGWAVGSRCEWRRAWRSLNAHWPSGSQASGRSSTHCSKAVKGYGHCRVR